MEPSPPGTRREHSSCGATATLVVLKLATLSVKGCSTAWALADGDVIRRNPAALTLFTMALRCASVTSLPPIWNLSPISTWGVPLHSLTSPFLLNLTFSSPTTCEYSQACTMHTGLPSLSVEPVG
ncbi:hypothetical protein D3C72_1398180 [compost metagenome]